MEKILSESRKQKMHDILCLFNDIYGTIDVLTLLSKDKFQGQLLTSINVFAQISFAFFEINDSDFLTPCCRIIDHAPFPKWFNVFDHLDTLITPFYFLCKNNNILLTVDIPNLLPSTINYTQSYMNLIFNFVMTTLIIGKISEIRVQFVIEGSIYFMTFFAHFSSLSHAFINFVDSICQHENIKFRIDSKNGIIEFQFPLLGLLIGSTAKSDHGVAAICITEESLKHQALIELQNCDISIYEFHDLNEFINIQSKFNVNYVIIDAANPIYDSIFGAAKKHSSFSHMIPIVEPDDQKYLLSIKKPIIAGFLRSKLKWYINSDVEVSPTYKAVIHHDIIPRKVLLIEDNLTNLFVMSRILDTFQCTCTTSNDGMEAIKKLDDGEFDIIFMDLWLSKMDGIKTTQIIRSSTKWYAHIPIIAISAVPEIKEECIKVGINAFYAKPVRIHEIKEALLTFAKR